MKSTVEALDDNKVKVSVEVEEQEFERAVDAAFRRLAREVRIPGFRPGKAPRRVLEARFGKGVAREDALRSALPDYYAQAVIEHDVDVIAAPTIDITGGHEAGPVQFDAVVEVRPRITVEGYADLEIEVPSPRLDEADVTERIDQIRRQHGELADADRPAQDGDHVTIDISGTYQGEDVPGLTATDYLYEVGAGAVVAEIDENLRGASAGDELSFTAPHPDPDEEDELVFSITVSRVQERVLPELTDEFVDEATEFETVDALRADIERRLGAMKKLQATLARRDKVVEAAAGLVDEVPQAMVDSGFQDRLQDFVQRLQQQGIGVEQYFAATGQSPEDVTAAMREQAEQAAKLDLALRAICEAEGLTATDDEVTEQLTAIAERAGVTVAVAEERFAAMGQLSDLKAEIGKRKALDWLVEHCRMVDPDGNPVSPDDLVLEQAEAAEAGFVDDDDLVGDLAEALAEAEEGAEAPTETETEPEEGSA